MVVATIAKAGIAAPIICDDLGALRHSTLDEAAKRFGTSVRYQGKSNTAFIPTILLFVEAAGTLALANFDGTSHEHHVLDAAPLAACASAHTGFIGLNNFAKLAADPVLVGADHTNPEFVENLVGVLVARQSELPLELDSRHIRRLADNKEAAENQTESGVCVRSMTVPAVRRARMPTPQGLRKNKDRLPRSHRTKKRSSSGDSIWAFISTSPRNCFPGIRPTGSSGSSLSWLPLT